MAKKIVANIKLQLPAGKANPSPPVGPAKSPHGATSWSSARRSTPAPRGRGTLIIPVVITVFSDRSFLYHQDPPASVLLRKAAGLDKGSGQPNRRRWASSPRSRCRRSPSSSRGLEHHRPCRRRAQHLRHRPLHGHRDRLARGVRERRRTGRRDRRDGGRLRPVGGAPAGRTGEPGECAAGRRAERDRRRGPKGDAWAPRRDGGARRGRVPGNQPRDGECDHRAGARPLRPSYGQRARGGLARPLELGAP